MIGVFVSFESPVCCPDQRLTITGASLHRLRCGTCQRIFADPASLSSDRLNRWKTTRIAAEECLFLEAQGIEPDEAADWAFHKVEGYFVPEWKRSGFSAFEAGWWGQRRSCPDDAVEWRQTRMPLDVVEALLAAGFFHPDEVARWTEAGFTLDECLLWRPQVDIRSYDQPGSYDLHEFGSIKLSEIPRWKSIGFPPEAFRAWSTYFDDPLDAWRYRSAGLKPTQAADCRRDGQTIEEWHASRPPVSRRLPVPTQVTEVRQYVRDKITLALGGTKRDARSVAAALIAENDLSKLYAMSSFASEYVKAARELIGEAIERPGLRSLLLSSADYRIVQHMMTATRLGALDEDYDTRKLQFNRSAWANELESSLAGKTGSTTCQCTNCKAWTRR